LRLFAQTRVYYSLTSFVNPASLLLPCGSLLLCPNPNALLRRCSTAPFHFALALQPRARHLPALLGHGALRAPHSEREIERTSDANTEAEKGNKNESQSTFPRKSRWLPSNMEKQPNRRQTHVPSMLATSTAALPCCPRLSECVLRAGVTVSEREKRLNEAAMASLWVCD
jgi:hypothetical protein